MGPPSQKSEPPFHRQHQPTPGTIGRMDPKPDHGETSYVGPARLKDKKALFMIAYLDQSEEADARETQRLVQEAGQECEVFRGDLSQPASCRHVVQRAVAVLGRIDVLVNNAAHQATFHSLEAIPDEEWDRTFATNISTIFHIIKTALPHMPAGSSIINTSSVNLDAPSPQLLPYATTKGAIQTLTAGLAQLLAERGIRANAVAPGPYGLP